MSLAKNVKGKAFEVLKIKEFTFVNDCFQNKNNAVFGVFLQRLNTWNNTYMNNIDLITVLGPTATGKTTFATHLALLLNAEIISADSRQVYKGMDIGTGKDLKDFNIDGALIPYHLIDIVDAGEKYNVFEFQSDFLKAYQDIKKRESFPIICGGTGMYIEAVLKGYKLINVPIDEELRLKLEKYNLEELSDMLAKIKTQHNNSDVDTKKRAIRAIEIETYYKNNSDIDFDYPTIKPLIFGIKFERSVVKERITERLKQRLREGMSDEAQQLLDSGIPAETLTYYGLEYKYLTLFLTKQLSYNEMFKQLNIAIHQFSKRQMTWFRKMERSGFKIHWIDGELSTEEKLNSTFQIIQKYT